MPNIPLIASLHHAKTNPEYGEVTVLLVEPSTNERPRPAKKEQFPPNQRIFVSRGYPDLEHRFDGSLFRIVSYSENREFGYQEGKTKFIIGDRDVEELRRDEYCRVYDVNDAPASLGAGEISGLKAPATRYFFIRDSRHGKLWGPFFDPASSRGPRGASARLLPVNEPLPGMTQDQRSGVFEIAENKLRDANALITIQIPSEEDLVPDSMPVVTNLTAAAAAQPQWIDRISDDGLLKWADTFLQHAPSRPRIVEALQDLRSAIDAQYADVSPTAKARLDRLRLLLAKTEFWQSQGPSLVRAFLDETDEGKKVVQQYLEAHRGELQKRLEAEQTDLFERIRQRKEEYEQLQATCSDLENRHRELGPIAALKATELSDAQLAELEARKKALLELTGVEAIRDQKIVLEADVKKLKKERDALAGNVETLRREETQLRADVGRSQEELRAKLRDLKPYVDLLSGVIPPPPTSTSPPSKREARPDALDARQIVDELKRFLAERGRAVSEIEAANWLVTTSQSFLTILAGLPGSGKTSLVCLLAEFLGLAASGDFLVIPVARGWASIKDLLGYYNPLSERFQPSATGLHEFLSTANGRDRSGESTTLQMVLLDEANLSPMEHYWSAFLAMADPEVQQRIVRTGAHGPDGQLAIPEGLRFLATINYDHTTEPISPRLLDRAPVILLEPPTGPTIAPAPVPTRSAGVVTLAQLRKCFAPDNSSISLTEDEERLLKQLREVLRDERGGGLPVLISPRRMGSVSRYCAAARPLMNTFHDGYPLCALDLAVAQMVLPCVTGRGDQFERRLKAALEVLPAESTPKARRALSRIIERGAQSHQVFQYLAWT